MFRSAWLVLLVGCYDDPKIVVHVHRDNVQLDVDSQVCGVSSGKCDPPVGFLVGTARVFGDDMKALEKDVSIFDDHGGTVSVRFQASFDSQLALCVNIDIGSMLIERDLTIHPMPSFSWSGPEELLSPCTVQ